MVGEPKRFVNEHWFEVSANGDLSGVSVRSRDGKLVHLYPDEEHVHPTKIDRGVCIVPQYDFEKEPESANALPDVITLGSNLLVSGRLWTIFKSVDLDPEMVCLPTDVVNRQQVKLAEYYYLCSSNSHVVLNEAVSGVVYYPTGGGAVKELDHWVLDPRLLPPLDLFFAHYSKWICSEKLAEMCHKADVTGIEWIELECSVSDSSPNRFAIVEEEKPLAPTTETTSCRNCGKPILQRTADKHGGLCKRCAG